MSDDTPHADLYATLAEVIRSNNSPAMQKAREAIAYRMAMSGDVAPARIPAPRNITEVGGYLNLLAKLNQPELTSQSLAAALGVAGPVSSLFDPAAVPSLFFREAPNDRPAGAQQPSFALSYWVRSDLAAPLANAVVSLHQYGATLPLLMAAPVLPAAGAAEPSADQLLALIGRRLRIAPTAALLDATADPILIARADDAAEWRVMARVLDSTAPKAGEAEIRAWHAFQCDATACSDVVVDETPLVDIAPILQQAGWFRRTPVAPPESPADMTGWEWLDNISGMVPGETRLGDELFRAFDQSAVAASALATMVDRVWNGTGFT